MSILVDFLSTTLAVAGGILLATYFSDLQRKAKATRLAEELAEALADYTEELKRMEAAEEHEAEAHVSTKKGMN